MNAVLHGDGAHHAEVDSHRVVERRLRIAVATRIRRCVVYLHFSVEVCRALFGGNVHDRTARISRWAGRFSRATSGGGPDNLTVRSH